MTETKGPTVEQQLNQLRSRLDVADRRIAGMLTTGGFADSKTLSMRSTRLEDRVAVLERDNRMLLDIAGLQASFIEEHLATEHGLDVNKSNAASVIWMRKVKRRLREWAEQCQLLKRGRSDVAEARRDENRLRPREQAAHS